MSVEERDRYTGHLTTGHDWNGIKELNTKVPNLLLACFGLAFLFAVGYWYLLPAWPLGDDYTKGKLNLDQKAQVQAQLLDADARMAEWSAPLQALNFGEIQTDPRLMSVVAKSGPTLFEDNCAMCHGQEGNGNLNFPKLTDSSWLWGGTPEQIEKTLHVGINADVEGTRMALMPAFGTTKLLAQNEIDDVVTYLQALNKGQIGEGTRAEEVLSAGRGATVFKAHCIACHGADAKGNSALGAPNLVDEYWMYGGDKESITDTLVNGRAGWMPAWSNRLTDAQIKILSLYVAGLPATTATTDAESN